MDTQTAHRERIQESTPDRRQLIIRHGKHCSIITTIPSSTQTKVRRWFRWLLGWRGREWCLRKEEKYKKLKKKQKKESESGSCVLLCIARFFLFCF